jgi:hypothetical protein
MFQELSQDPRKMPFYFEYLLTDLTDMDQSRLEQVHFLLVCFCPRLICSWSSVSKHTYLKCNRHLIAEQPCSIR